jgi:hypothetical protein
LVYGNYVQIIEILRACYVYDPRRKTHQEIYFVYLDNDSACAFLTQAAKSVLNVAKNSLVE